MDYILSILFIFLQSFLVIFAVLMMAYFGIYGERKLWAAVQLRKGPNIVGPFGLLQPVADFLKLLLKEPIIPNKANKIIFVMAPIVTCFVALSAWAVVPFADNWVVADINVGILYIFAISSLMIGIISLVAWTFFGLFEET